MQTKPTGHTVPTPTTRPTPTEAITASILATWYIRNGKKIQAQRKLRQALQALGQ
jgi:Flp pilus assembly protein TadD